VCVCAFDRWYTYKSKQHSTRKEKGKNEMKENAT